MTGNQADNGHGQREPQPMPQTGVYPVEKFCMWLECPMNELLVKFEELGVPVVNGTADMAVLLAAIERQEEHGEEG